MNLKFKKKKKYKNLQDHKRTSGSTHCPVSGSMSLWPVCRGPSDWSMCTWHSSRHARGGAWWECTCDLADLDRVRPKQRGGQRRGGRAERCTVTSRCPRHSAQRSPPCPDRLHKKESDRAEFSDKSKLSFPTSSSWIFRQVPAKFSDKSKLNFPTSPGWVETQTAIGGVNCRLP